MTKLANNITPKERIEVETGLAGDGDHWNGFLQISAFSDNAPVNIRPFMAEGVEKGISPSLKTALILLSLKVMRRGESSDVPHSEHGYAIILPDQTAQKTAAKLASVI